MGHAGLDEARLKPVALIRLARGLEDLPAGPKVLGPGSISLALDALREVVPEASYLAIHPMRAQQELVGLLVVGFASRGPMPADLDFLRSAADQLGLTIRNTQLYEQEQRSRVEAEALLKALRQMQKVA